MPIRINLLAEQQAAEEARRRDPVKRALWVGGTLVALMLIWASTLQVRVMSAKSELSSLESRLQAVEENSKEIRLDFATVGRLEKQLMQLERYSTNRFFCAPVLDALQQVVLDDVRVMELQTAHTYSTNAESSFKTNLVFPVQAKSRWQLWKSSSNTTNLLTLVSNQLSVITNQVAAFKAAPELTTKVEISTNAGKATAKIEIVKPATASEHVSLTLKARDYSSPNGRRVDDFSRAIATHPYFAQRLLSGEEGIRLRERSIQPDVDQTDGLHAGKPFIPFVIECRYRETARANE